MIELTGDFGARVARRLEQEIIIWLTTVRADGTPQPSPVWFVWSDDALLIYSQPNKQKLRNIARSPNVALNFDGNGQGGDIVVISGQASIDPSAPPCDQVAAYVTKYRDHIIRIGYAPATFAAGYSVAIRVTPTALRGF
jgi:PPOX class probable F420-dependent enzyme